MIVKRNEARRSIAVIPGRNKKPTLTCSVRVGKSSGRLAFSAYRTQLSESSLAFYDLLRRSVPDGYALVEVGVVGQVAADGGVVAEGFVFGDRLATADGVVEVGLVSDGVAVVGRQSIAL